MLLHAGTAAFGSAIIPFVKGLRAVLMSCQRHASKAKEQQNALGCLLLSCVGCCCGCCFGCVDNCLR